MLRFMHESVEGGVQYGSIALLARAQCLHPLEHLERHRCLIRERAQRMQHLRIRQ